MTTKTQRPLPIIFTDLDGTLLDRNTYSYEKARSALNSAQHHGIPVVFCSSKTRAEQMVYRRELGIVDPFIVEDGGAIFIEVGYFRSPLDYPTSGDHYVIELGTPYEVIRKSVDEVRHETGIELTGYGDMGPADVAHVTGLDMEGAALAMKREYQETIVSSHTAEELGRVAAAFSARGIRLTKGGRFLGVSGEHDKGAAVDVLAELYRRDFSDVLLIGLGDSHNDLPLLNAVQVPVLVQKKPGLWEEVDVPGLIRVDGVGPDGWSQFVSEHLLR